MRSKDEWARTGSGDGGGKDRWVWRGTAQGFHLEGAVVSTINLQRIPKNGIAGSEGKQSLCFIYTASCCLRRC